MIACYDLTYQPASFDFMTFLVVAKTHGATHIRLHDDSQYPAKDYKDPQERIRSIIEPGSALAGLDYTKGEKDGFAFDHLAGAPLRTFAVLGFIEKLKGVIPPKTGDYVTVTLRKSRKEHRNSNAEAWKQAFSGVKERVVFVSDYEEQPIHLHERMSLYEGARMNFFSSQGPAVLGYYSDIPYAVLNMYGDGGDLGREKKYLEYEGLHCDFQWPWAHGKQRIFWVREDEETIRSAYEWSLK